MKQGRAEEKFLIQGIADVLVSEYGEDAILAAALCAHKAMTKGQIESCRIWRDILNALEQKRRSCPTGFLGGN